MIDTKSNAYEQVWRGLLDLVAETDNERRLAGGLSVKTYDVERDDLMRALHALENAQMEHGAIKTGKPVQFRSQFISSIRAV